DEIRCAEHDQNAGDCAERQHEVDRDAEGTRFGDQRHLADWPLGRGFEQYRAFAAWNDVVVAAQRARLVAQISVLIGLHRMAWMSIRSPTRNPACQAGESSSAKNWPRTS